MALIENNPLNIKEYHEMCQEFFFYYNFGDGN